MTPHKREFLRGLHNIRPEHAGNVVTIGAFDGVHLGHQAILKQVVEKAEHHGLPALAMIFEPQPHEFFSGEKAPARLMRLGEKVEALFAQGIQRVFCLPFNMALSQLSADDFVRHILVEALGTRHLVVGDDFRFGSQRLGDYPLLCAAGEQYGFQVTDTITYLKENERVSSTKIREVLERADFDHVTELLGKPYTISGRVVKGQQLGRTIDYPTANIVLPDILLPINGVFAVRVELQHRDVVAGVANIGSRPTVDGKEKRLEVHLFDFDQDIYDQKIIVSFVEKIRDEAKFDSFEDLKTQIHEDAARARVIFSVI